MQLDELSKEEVLARIREAGIAPALALSEALTRYPVLQKVRQSLIDHFGDTAAMAELSDGAPQAWLPEVLRPWPVWYLRLPQTWAADIPSLAASPSLSLYTQQSPDPWCMAQWVALRSSLPPSTDEGFGRYLRFMDQAVDGKLDRVSGSTAVLVLIECEERLYVTGFPLGEAFAIDWSCHINGSSSCVTFDRTVATLQAQVRDAEAGLNEPFGPDCLTLPVLHFSSKEKAIRARQEKARVNAPRFPETPSVLNYQTVSGAVGLLHTIVDYVPPELDADRQLWLKLTVPSEMFVSMQEQAPLVHVRHLPPTATSAALIAITVCSGPYLFIAYAPAQDSRLALALDAFAATGNCPLALENRRNGRLHVVSLPWPADCHGARDDTGSSERGKFSNWWPEAAHDEAMRLLKRINARVMLYTCEIVDAATWQQGELMARGHAEGPCAGVRRIP
jgi:hypothetical protein